MDAYILSAQAIGFVGTALLILAFQFKANHWLFFCQMLGSFAYIIHFAMLGAWPGCFNLVVNFLRSSMLVLQKRGLFLRRRWLFLLLCLPSAGTAFTWAALRFDPLDALSCFAITVMTAALWKRNGRIIRICGFCISSPCWMVYDWHVGSVSGVVCEMIAMLSIAVSVWRHGRKALDCRS